MGAGVGVGVGPGVGVAVGPGVGVGVGVGSFPPEELLPQFSEAIAAIAIAADLIIFMIVSLLSK